MPQEVKVGEPYHQSIFTGSKRRLVERQDSFQYVPLLRSLQVLLSDSSIIDQIYQCPSRFHRDGTIEDICDGELYKAHPIFSNDPLALQLILFYDELELCNPLGTHVKKHKLGIFLFTLGNIHPKYRSALRVINLLIAATVPVVMKHGHNQILQPLLQDLQTLATDGIVVTIKGVEETFRGAVLMCLGDNLGSNALGGFKESFSFASRFCRTCYVLNTAYKTLSISTELELRSEDKHRCECDLVNGPLHDHYSKTYGINRRSALLDIPFYSMFKGGLPHDSMHDILEGVAPLEISLLLCHCIISKRLLSLEEYNRRLLQFDFGYTEASKAPPITSRSTLIDGKHLKASASQMLLLIRILPLMVGDLIPESDPNWKCFLTFAKIVDIIMCPVASADLCAVLKVLIEEHHRLFISLYSEGKVIPKFHFLLHYPKQILSVGPMVRTWNMRNEAKLYVFKQAARLGNFKNIAFSVANRHQRLQCYELASGNLLSTPNVYGPSVQTQPLESEPSHVQDALNRLLSCVSYDTIVSRPAWVKLLNSTIKKDAYVITKYDGHFPVFSKIHDILVLCDTVVLHVFHCVTEYFDDHYHAYAVLLSQEHSYVCFDDILDNTILHSHKRNNNFFTYI